MIYLLLLSCRMDSPDYTFTKETIFNNNGAFGSDLTRYKLFKNGQQIGEVNHDSYYRKTIIELGEVRYRISSGWTSWPALYNDKTSEKIAKIRISSGFFNRKSEATLTFRDGIKFKILINDFISEKTYKTRLYSHSTDVIFDFILLRPRTEFTLLREIPLEGEIATNGENATPLLILSGLALLELLIIFCEQQRNAN